MFSEDVYDLDARIEPYPHRYIMGKVDGEIVVAMGLYTHDTYTERFGEVTDDEIRDVLEGAGVGDQYVGFVRHELTKLVVKSGWEGYGLARRLHEAAHADRFMVGDETRPVVITMCALVSFMEHMLAPKGKIKGRFLAPFPRYPVHSAYRSDQDPMETRMTIPSLDVPEALRTLELPIEVELIRRTVREGQ
ncbi:MAG: hypothetical protein KDA28_17030 [Phycisphaerales bacterium]|nr:hypothetical protein [Phycisphaerales bacterium]